MKKIIPFNNVLEFKTDIAKIVGISLEHEIKKEEGSICGEFFISGEYKITDGQLETEKFNFELPFDIAFGCNYNLETLIIDIDDFRYEVIDKNKLKVNIDLYVDGEELEEERTIPIEENGDEEVVIEKPMLEVDNGKVEENIIPEDDLDETKEETVFGGFNEEEKYVTYRVYRVSEGDTIDKVMEKYKVTKEELLKYNSSVDIKAGDKLIIPAND